MANVYVAAKFEEAPLARAVMDRLEALGHVITHDWTGENSVGLSGDDLKLYLAKCARQDFFGVVAADVILVLNHDRLFGGMVETGVALGLGKPVVLVSADKRDCIFWHLKEVRKVDDVDQALKVIENLFPPQDWPWWGRLRNPVYVCSGRESVAEVWKRLYGEDFNPGARVSFHDFGDSEAWLMPGMRVVLLSWMGNDSIYELE